MQPCPAAGSAVLASLMAVGLMLWPCSGTRATRSNRNGCPGGTGGPWILIQWLCQKRWLPSLSWGAAACATATPRASVLIHWQGVAASCGGRVLQRSAGGRVPSARVRQTRKGDLPGEPGALTRAGRVHWPTGRHPCRSDAPIGRAAAAGASVDVTTLLSQRRPMKPGLEGWTEKIRNVHWRPWSGESGCPPIPLSETSFAGGT